MRIVALMAACASVTAGAAEPQRVTAGGISLSSVSVEWPTGDQAFPTGPGVEAVNQNCTGCHSPNMVLLQPALSQSTWQAEVAKMRSVYKASIDEAAVPVIVGYLTGLPSQQRK